MTTTSEPITEKELILCAVFKILEGDAQILLNTRPITAAAQSRAESLINAQDVILGMLRDPVE